jgi:hypothetical protein
MNASQRVRQQLIALVVSLFLESLARCSRNQASSSTMREPAALLAYAQAVLRRKTVDLAFDGEQNIDALDRLGRDRRLTEPREIEKLAPAVRPARSLDDRTCFAIGLIKPAEAGVGIGLHQSGIARQ